jgi:hypothetical protein
MYAMRAEGRMSDAAEALASAGAHGPDGPVDAIERLRALGLSESGVLSSTGLARHRQRLHDGAISPQALDEYASSLEPIVARASVGTHGVPVHFWDACSPEMQRVHYDEYRMARTFALPELAPYLALLGRAFDRFAAMKSGADTAVATALAILEDASAYVRAGHSTCMIRALPWLDQAQQALVLWQQILTGSTRRLPLIGLEVIPHGMWGHFNVTTMWQYARGTSGERAALWGVSGFHRDYVGPASNNNQIEHMAISAVTRRVFHVPVVALSAVEYAQWKLQPGVKEGEARADSALNHAVARDLLSYYSVSNPARACVHFVQALSQPAPQR